MVVMPAAWSWSRRRPGRPPAPTTPRESLAEEVVEHALEPLVYRPGPHQTADRDAVAADLRSDRDPRPQGRRHRLRVRRLPGRRGPLPRRPAGRGLARRGRRGRRPARSCTSRPSARSSPRCLYGADINGMAVEMCKLSLWLVSLDPKLPFSFVDDKVLHGNSLLGLTDVRQLKALHIDPDAASDQASLLRPRRRRDRCAGPSSLRQQLASEVDDADPQRSATTKRRLLGRVPGARCRTLATVADGVVAAGLALGGKPGKALERGVRDLRAGGRPTPSPPTGERRPAGCSTESSSRGLTPTVPTDYDAWKPLHWILAVPDVMERGGFDAVVGNPPFLGGQKLTGSMGTNVRDWFVHTSGRRAAGQRRPGGLLLPARRRAAHADGHPRADRHQHRGPGRHPRGRARPDGGRRLHHHPRRSRAVLAGGEREPRVRGGLGHPGTVADGVPRIADDVRVPRISTLLEPAAGWTGSPSGLTENQRYRLPGLHRPWYGFRARSRRGAGVDRAGPAQSPRCCSPTSTAKISTPVPTLSASRWVIDFNDRSEAMQLDVSRSHSTASRSSPVRARAPESQSEARSRRAGGNSLAKRPGLRKAIAELDEVLVIALVSKTVMPMRVPTARCSAMRSASSPLTRSPIRPCCRRACTRPGRSSTAQACATIRATRRRTSSRPFLARADRLAGRDGPALDVERREIMLRRQLGLTKLYNLVNDPDIADRPTQMSRGCGRSTSSSTRR